MNRGLDSGATYGDIPPTGANTDAALRQDPNMNYGNTGLGNDAGMGTGTGLNTGLGTRGDTGYGTGNQGAGVTGVTAGGQGGYGSTNVNYDQNDPNRPLGQKVAGMIPGTEAHKEKKLENQAMGGSGTGMGSTMGSGMGSGYDNTNKSTGQKIAEHIPGTEAHKIRKAEKEGTY